jgi:hypothetical protein
VTDYIGATALVVAILLWWKLLKHRHTWTGWTDWVENRANYDEVNFIRERYCQTCKAKDRHAIGDHRCNVVKAPEYTPCPHRNTFIAAFDKDVAISNIEKELGL